MKKEEKLNDFEKAFELIKFGTTKQDKKNYEFYLNKFERDRTLNLFMNWCFDKGYTLSKLKPEVILEQEGERPYLIYAKAPKQTRYKAMDMNLGIQVANKIRATLFHQSEETMQKYIRELKEDNPDWEFKFLRA